MKNVVYSFFFLILFSAINVSAESQKPIKLGATLTLSGGTSFWGHNALKGMTLAVEKINAKGGISGRPVKIIFEDFGETELSKAATAATKLLQIDHVSVIFTQWSEDSEVIWPLAERKGIPIVSFSAGAKGITAKSPYFFRVWPSDETFITKTIDFVLKQGKKKAAILSAQTAYFDSLKEITQEVWQASTGTSAYTHEVPSSRTDFRTELLKIKRSGADVVFFHVPLEREGLLLKQAEEIKLQALKIGTQHSDTPTVLDVAGIAAENLIFPRYVPAEKSFKVEFLKRFSETPGVPAEYAYDAIMVVAEAMRKYGTDSMSVRQGLLTLRDYRGASGSISLDETGDRQSKEVELLIIQNGKSRKISSV